MISFLILLAVQLFILWIAYDMGYDSGYERHYKETHK